MLKLYDIVPHLKTVVKETGYIDLRSLWFLHNLVKNIKPMRIIELGTGYGCSTIFMALGLHSSGKIYSVDDYRGDVSESIERTQSNIDKCGVSKLVQLIEGDTRNVIQIDKGPAKLVFMDASHNPSDLFAELAALQPNLSGTHILVIDDIFSVDLDKFIFDLMKNKMYLFVMLTDFHNGMAILSNQAGALWGMVAKSMQEAGNV